MQYFSAFVLLLPSVLAAQAPSFVKPAAGPLDASPNSGGPSNGSLPKPSVVAGKQFDRFIQIWLENTDFESANSTATFANLATQGIRLDQYYALTHPSEPNYAAVVGGDFWGMADDNLYNIPSNIVSTGHGGGAGGTRADCGGRVPGTRHVTAAAASTPLSASQLPSDSSPSSRADEHESRTVQRDQREPARARRALCAVRSATAFVPPNGDRGRSRSPVRESSRSAFSAFARFGASRA